MNLNFLFIQDLGLLFSLVIMGMLFYGSLEYFIENGEEDTGFYSIPQAQLRFERDPSVHKLFLNMLWIEQNHCRQDNAILEASFSLVSTKLLATLLGKNPLTPHLFLYLLMTVSQILVVQGMWWAVQTLTSLGYGDFCPNTVLGKILAL